MGRVPSDIHFNQHGVVTAFAWHVMGVSHRSENNEQFPAKINWWADAKSDDERCLKSKTFYDSEGRISAQGKPAILEYNSEGNLTCERDVRNGIATEIRTYDPGSITPDVPVNIETIDPA